MLAQLCGCCFGSLLVVGPGATTQLTCQAHKQLDCTLPSDALGHMPLLRTIIALSLPAQYCSLVFSDPEQCQMS